MGRLRKWKRIYLVTYLLRERLNSSRDGGAGARATKFTIVYGSRCLFDFGSEEETRFGAKRRNAPQRTVPCRNTSTEIKSYKTATKKCAIFARSVQRDVGGAVYEGASQILKVRPASSPMNLCTRGERLIANAKYTGIFLSFSLPSLPLFLFRARDKRDCQPSNANLIEIKLFGLLSI